MKAIEAEDETELSILLVERTDFHSVREWYGEIALILAVRSAESGGIAFAEAAVRLFVSHGANINEPGAEWKTALIHAAAIGNWDLCATPWPTEPIRQRAIWLAKQPPIGRSTGDIRIASLLRKLEA